MRIRKPAMRRQRFVFPKRWRSVRSYIREFEHLNNLVPCRYLIQGEVS